MNKKALGLLSLARRARLLEAGEEPVGALCRAHKARLVLVAADAGGHTLRRVQSFVEGTEQPVLQLSCEKEALGAAIGQSVCAVAAFSDQSFAFAFAQALEECPPELTETLRQRAERAAQRKKEALAHEKNKKQGKKPRPAPTAPRTREIKKPSGNQA